MIIRQKNATILIFRIFDAYYHTIEFPVYKMLALCCADDEKKC